MNKIMSVSDGYSKPFRMPQLIFLHLIQDCLHLDRNHFPTVFYSSKPCRMIISNLKRSNPLFLPCYRIKEG